MTRGTQFFNLLVTCLCVAGVYAQSTPADIPAVSTAKPVVSEGEITGRDVYVRSGASLNHYEICKLQMGDKVSIVGHDGDWYEILPPKDAFSLIAGEYVDTTDNQTGVVNGNNVRVRAGSTLNANKYTVQVMLSRGAQVSILASNPDGFLRIKPPVGATVWINKQFVKAGTTIPGDVQVKSGSAETSEPVAKSEAVPTNTIAAPSADGEKLASANPADPTRSEHSTSKPVVESHETTTEKTVVVKQPADSKPQHEYRKELEALDAAARTELAKDVGDRNWAPLVAKYETIEKQADDEVSRVYAKHRVEQLTDLMSVTTTIRELKSLDENSDDVRRAYLEQRNLLPPVVPLNHPVGVDAQGELRVSALYPPGSLPRRYRLIDPTTPSPKTVAYVEIPPDSTIEIDRFIGRFVGIRASNKTLQTSGANPVPILVASEIVSLSAPESSGEPKNANPTTPAEPVGAKG